MRALRFIAVLSLLAGCTEDTTAPTDASTDGSLDASTPVRSCATVFSLNLGRPARAVAVAGEWNAFSATATPMTDTGGGVFRAEVNLPPGNYGYKFASPRAATSVATSTEQLRLAK